MTMNYPFPSAMNGADSNSLLSGYNNAGLLQNRPDNATAGAAGLYGPNSMAMPRVVDCSDAYVRNQGTGTLGGTGADDNSSFSGPITASSGFTSSKNYANNTLDSSFDCCLDSSASKSNSNANYADGLQVGDVGTNNELLKSLTLKLRIKETQNESLENEIQKLRGSFNEALNFKQSEYKQERQILHKEKTSLEAPKDVEQVFRRLSSTLRSKDDELVETKNAFESIPTALALDPSNSVTKYGRYDAEALAHKMVTRIEILTKENQEMAKMLAYGRAKEMQIERQLAQMKNKELNATISKLKEPEGAQKE
ncbi:hypothetical protein HG536_0F04070 [Torulaspora globosa]|uniref:Uncharacterized protein n=1 Tax=Torulaspora globosa TaxID=48254 RepID=A0A7G3ZKP5_9SACH|nr:uncharacterized protein HG536_0F04070 [Torulaspora globosa]QLL34081.1 hypothetical protein HG536_0F04070 [Torulaspora globosa]